jgi:ABC-2 type transport system permease protein
MSVVAASGSAALAILKRDALMFVSYRMRFMTQALSLIFSVTLFYYVSRLVTIDTFASPDAYFAFVVVGILIFQVVTSTMAMLPVTVRQELVAGTFERLVLSPFGAVAGVLAMTIFPLLRSLLLGVVMLGFAALAFSLDLEWSTAALALPIGLLGALAFMPFAALFTAAVLAFKQAPGAGFVVSAISLVSGLYFPVDLLPGWIEWTSEVQPFTPTVDLMRHLLVGTPLGGSALVDVAKLAGFAGVLLPLSIWILTKALQAGQRRGTVIEF